MIEARHSGTEFRWAVRGIASAFCSPPSSTFQAMVSWGSAGCCSADEAREFAQAILMACDKADELNGEKNAE